MGGDVTPDDQRPNPILRRDGYPGACLQMVHVNTTNSGRLVKTEEKLKSIHLHSDGYSALERCSYSRWYFECTRIVQLNIIFSTQKSTKMSEACSLSH